MASYLLKSLRAFQGEHIPPTYPLAPMPDPSTLRQPCEDNGEPLVDLEGFIPTFNAYAALQILRPRPIKVRAGVARRLHDVCAELPEPFGLVILDGWRTIAEQNQLRAHYQVESQFVASTSSDRIRPPHTTGGAVDLTLSYNGGPPLALGTDYDDFTDAARLDSLEGTDQTAARDLRRLLASALIQGGGFAPFAPEWWHWSYGDDVWAALNGRPALYDIHAGDS